MNYFNPLTGNEIKEKNIICLNGMLVPDFRKIGNPSLNEDEYGSADPYPKEDGRHERLEKFVRDVVLPLAPELLSGPCVVLDAGCGTGDWLEAIMKCTTIPHHWHVAEYSPSALQSCLIALPKIESACLFDANFPPFQSAAFDVIFAINVFEHIKAPTLYLEGLLNALKPNGVLIMTTPSRYRLKNLIKACLGRRSTLIHPLHMTEYTVGQVHDMVQFVGGKIESTAGTSLTDKAEKFFIITTLLSRSAQWFLSRVMRSHHLFHSTIYYRITKKM